MQRFRIQSQISLSGGRSGTGKSFSFGASLSLFGINAPILSTHSCIISNVVYSLQLIASLNNTFLKCSPTVLFIESKALLSH